MIFIDRMGTDTRSEVKADVDELPASTTHAALMSHGKLIAAGAPYIQDAVLTGLNMKEVGAMIFPTPAVRALSGLPADAPLADVLASAPVLAKFQEIVNELAKTGTGSANRIARLCLLSEPPTIDRGEVTDKGSINQRAVLAHRADTVDALHAGRLHHILFPA